MLSPITTTDPDAPPQKHTQTHTPHTQTPAAILDILGNSFMGAGILLYLIAAGFGGHVCLKNPESIEGGQRAFIGYAQQQLNPTPKPLKVNP